ncbi:MAG: pyridoxal phosphate-dependent decarboxylase family protein [Microthrixaceae bacterium]
MGGIPFPDEGRSSTELLKEMRTEREGDLDWRGGKAFSLVYNPDDPTLEELQHEVAGMFLHENALNPFRYATLLRMEGEVLSMTQSLFGATAGSLSSGGTESIFLAVQTARDHARAEGVAAPELLCATTAHPAFAKACKYLDVRQVFTEIDAGGRAVPEAYAEAMNPNTALVVVSAPSYPFGVIDPISDIAAIAAQRDVLCHVDACLGGWLLPFWEELGEPVEPWDFRVEGVTSLSADIHKYGYCFKGVSTINYRDKDLYQRQIFMYDSWPGGLYASASSAGTRPGPPIAAAWATITHLGREGYLRLGARVLEATRGFKAAVGSVDGLVVAPTPDMSVFQLAVDPAARDEIDIEAVGDRMDERGWNMDRQQGGLHVMLSPGHDKVADLFATDLAASVADQGTASGTEHTYGGVVEG